MFGQVLHTELIGKYEHSCPLQLRFLPVLLVILISKFVFNGVVKEPINDLCKVCRVVLLKMNLLLSSFFKFALERGFEVVQLIANRIFGKNPELFF